MIYTGQDCVKQFDEHFKFEKLQSYWKAKIHTNAPSFVIIHKEVATWQGRFSFSFFNLCDPILLWGEREVKIAKTFFSHKDVSFPSSVE